MDTVRFQRVYDMADIQKIMLEVAEAVANRAKAADQPPFAEQIDALKALTAMYTAMQKHPTEPPENEPEGFDFQRGVNAPEEDSSDGGTSVTPIRARRRPG